MHVRQFKLKNAVHWNAHVSGNKVYMPEARVVLADPSFNCRKVMLRFDDGPSVDFSIYDMDHIVATYLALRGLKLPEGLEEPPYVSEKAVPWAFQKT